MQATKVGGEAKEEKARQDVAARVATADTACKELEASDSCDLKMLARQVVSQADAMSDQVRSSTREGISNTGDEEWEAGQVGEKHKEKKKKQWSRRERPTYPKSLLPAPNRFYENGCGTDAPRCRIPLNGDKDQGEQVWYFSGVAPESVYKDFDSGALIAELGPYLVPVGKVGSGGGRSHAVFLFDEDVEETMCSKASGDSNREPKNLRYYFGGTWWETNEDVPEAIRKSRNEVMRITGSFFNGAVVNVYDTSRSKISWHSDDEYHLGPMVATLSLGRPQTMEFRERSKATNLPDSSIELEHGSLLVMCDGVQVTYLHRVLQASPRQLKQGTRRISITFHHHRRSIWKHIQKDQQNRE